MTCRLEPPVPRLKNTDDEDLLLTRVRFDAADPARLESALDAHPALRREGEGRTAWSWSGRNAHGAEVSLGRIVLKGSALLLECNSAARGERGRALVEALDAGSITHRSTTHESLAATLRETVRTGGARQGAERPDDIPREVQEALVLEHYARHYRAWMDEPIPALDNRTPREAAKVPALRPKLVGLVDGLEGMYERALRTTRQPTTRRGCGTSSSLDGGRRPAHPPPLAHERVAERVPGLAEVSRPWQRACEGRPASTRRRSSRDCFLAADLQVRRFLRDAERPDRRAWPTTSAAWSQLRAPPPQDLLGRRRAGVHAREHRPRRAGRRPARPVPVLRARTHRPHGALAGGAPPLPGTTVDRRGATSWRRDDLRDRGATRDERALHLEIALDSLGADPPSLAVHEVPLAEDESVQRYLEGVAPAVGTARPGRLASPSRPAPGGDQRDPVRDECRRDAEPRRDPAAAPRTRRPGSRGERPYSPPTPSSSCRVPSTSAGAAVPELERVPAGGPARPLHGARPLAPAPHGVARPAHAADRALLEGPGPGRHRRAHVQADAVAGSTRRLPRQFEALSRSAGGLRNDRTLQGTGSAVLSGRQRCCDLVEEGAMAVERPGLAGSRPPRPREAEPAPLGGPRWTGVAAAVEGLDGSRAGAVELDQLFVVALEGLLRSVVTRTRPSRRRSSRSS